MAFADEVKNTGTQMESDNSVMASGFDPISKEVNAVPGYINTAIVDEILPYDPMDPPEITGIPEIPEDTEAPKAPGNVVAVVSGSAIQINWDASWDNTAVRGYRIYRDEVEIGNSDGICYTDTSFTEGATYLYSVRAYDTAGNLSEAGVSMPVTAAVQDREEAANPDKPVGLTAMAGEAEIILEWLEVAEADSYELCINGDIINVGNTTSYIHTNVTANCSYEYKVRAINKFGASDWSDIVVLFSGIGKAAALSQVIIPGGTITEDTVWDSTEGIYLVQGSLIIAPEATLRIMQGTIVLFEPASGMTVNGNLIAEGSEEQPVVITSARDAEYGGSGIDPNTSKDIWYGITVSEEGGFTGNYIMLRYGGRILRVEGELSLNYSRITNSFEDGIWIDSNNSVTIQNSIIENSNGYNVSIDQWFDEFNGKITLINNIIQGGLYGGVYINGYSNDLTIKNNIIRNNSGYGIYISWNNTTNDISENDILNNDGPPIYTELGWIRSEAELDTLWNNNFSGNYPMDTIMLSGYLNADITLTKEYIINSIDVRDGITLIIQPGIVMRFMSTMLRAGMGISGRMIAVGTADEPIIFTSIFDPEYGGSGITGEEDGFSVISVSTDGEFIGDYIKIKYCGSYSVGSLVIWGKSSLTNSVISDSFSEGITIYSGSDVTIQNSVIEGSRNNGIGIGDKISVPTLARMVDSQDGILQSDDSKEDYGTITIKNDIIRDSSFSGIFISRSYYDRIVIENNTIEDYGDYPIKADLLDIYSSEALSHISGNLIKDEASSQYIGLSGKLWGEITLPKSERNYEVYGRITIRENAALTIDPGVILLMKSQNGVGMDVQGRLTAEGTAQEPVVFTSLDDPRYGDDMTVVAETGSKWEGIHITDSGEFTGNYTVIRNGGYRNTGEYGALYAEGKLNLYYSEVTDSYGYGIYFNTGEQPILFYNTFTGNPYAVYNANSNTEINASWNYWNSIYGPSVYRQIYDPHQGTWNPEWIGNGEKLYGEVDYSPYLGFDMTGPVHFGRSEGAYAPTGNYSKQFTDLSLNSSDNELTFTRLYNSQNAEETGIFGKGWSFNYESDIREHELFGDIRIVSLPDGSQESYTLNSDGFYTANSSRNTLVRQADGSYILTTKEQVKYGFNSDGILTWTENREGNRINIQLTPEGKPLSITDYAGREYRFVYEGGLLKTITDPAGRMVNYMYDSERLVEVTDPDGITTHYGYDADGYLSEIRDGNDDRIEAVTYRISDGIAQVEQATDAYGNVKTYTYDEVSGKTIITDSNGNMTTQWYDTTYNITYTTDAEGRLQAEAYTTEDGVNKYGEVKSVTDRNGNTTTYEYDERGNITKITNPDLSYRLYTYDGKNNIISEQEEAGKYTYYIYDAADTLLLKRISP